jgi:hypothetical protein
MRLSQQEQPHHRHDTGKIDDSRHICGLPIRDRAEPALLYAHALPRAPGFGRKYPALWRRVAWALV